MDTPNFAGRYSDGRTAATRQVAVRFGAGLEIAGSGSPAAETWAFDKLRAAAPVRWRDDEVLLRSSDHPGVTLFVADPGFASVLLKHAPRLSPGAHRWRYAMPGLAITAALIATIGAIYLFELRPSKTLAGLVPHALRAAIGEKAAIELAAGHDICASPAGSKALGTLVAELSAASGSGSRFEVRVVRWDLVNAFAVPGEQIVVSGGLIGQAQSAEEVAGVLAHEMGHGIELDPEAGIIRSLGLTALIELFASGQSSTVSNAGSLLLQLHYSREAEHRADAQALRILKNADISPKPFAEFFNRLLQLEAGSDGTPAAKDKSASLPQPDLQIFATHPPTPERAKMAADAATYDGKPALSEADWQALKHICD